MKKVALLDVNAILALLIENHEFHTTMADWFARNEKSGWATCPVTQQGFVRIVSNPAYMNPAPRVGAAIQLLAQTLAASIHHQFWTDEISLPDLDQHVLGRLSGHQQLTDAYLLSLAIRRQGKLLTFDKRVLRLAPDGSAERTHLEILEPRDAIRPR
jgi:uncharacterized protein